jgi:hypothetical protein
MTLTDQKSFRRMRQTELAREIAAIEEMQSGVSKKNL